MNLTPIHYNDIPDHVQCLVRRAISGSFVAGVFLGQRGSERIFSPNANGDLIYFTNRNPDRHVIFLIQEENNRRAE